MLVRRYFARKVDNNEKQESLAPSSMGNTLADKISVLVAFLVMMTMMFVLLLQASEINVSPQALLNTISHVKNVNEEYLDTIAEDFRAYEIAHKIVSTLKKSSAHWYIMDLRITTFLFYSFQIVD